MMPVVSLHKMTARNITLSEPQHAAVTIQEQQTQSTFTSREQEATHSFSGPADLLQRSPR